MQTNQGADDVTLALEISTDLAAWGDPPAEAFSITETSNGDGTGTLTFQSTPEFLTVEDRRFLRLRVDLIP